MKQTFLTTVMLVAAFCLQAAEPFKVKLYPTGPKESTYVTEPETNVNNRLRNVTEPRMEVFLPEGESTGRFVVICPGGGYGFCSKREAEVIALQFSAAHFLLSVFLAIRKLPACHDRQEFLVHCGKGRLLSAVQR